MQLGAEGLLRLVEHDREVGRPLLGLHVAQELPQHVAEAEHGIDLQPVGLAVERRQRVIGAENVGRAVDQKDVVAFLRRPGEGRRAASVLCGLAWHGSDLTLEGRFRHRFEPAMHVSSCAFPKAERACKVAAMTAIGNPLPIHPARPELTSALRAANAAVLVAPPGAGKTTRVPLALAAEPWARGKKLLVLEPRRLAARAAAARMAATLREAVGASVGYRVRFGSKISAATRIEVVTEGVFTRLVLDDPSLAGVAAVLFDEFHERSLDGALGLALARDVQQGLRAELKLLVMSATLDGARVGKLLGGDARGAKLVESAGRAFPVETRYLGRDAHVPFERQVADAVARSLRADAGSLL